MVGTPEQNAWVETVLGVPIGPNPSPDASAAISARFADWLAARKRFDRDLARLKDAITLRFARLGYGPKLARAFDATLAAELRTLDDQLSAAVGALTKGDPKHLGPARQAVDAYAGFLQSGDIAQALAANPFAGLSPQAALAPALTALARALDGAA